MMRSRTSRVMVIAHICSLVAVLACAETNTLIWNDQLPGRTWCSSDADIKAALLTNFWSFSLESSKVTDWGLLLLRGATNVVEIGLRSTAITDEGMKALATLPNLATLSLAQMEVHPSTLEPLRHAAGLRCLYLDRIARCHQGSFPSLGNLVQVEHIFFLDGVLAPEGLEGLERLGNLKSLDLSGTQLGKADLERIGRLTGIEKLSLGHCPGVDDKTLPPIGALTNLTWLSLAITPVTDEGLAMLRGCVRLNTLILQDTHVTGTGLGNLGCSASLQYLQLTGCPLSSTGLSHIVRFKELRDLGLKKTTIGDADLQQFKSLGALKSLDLYGTKVTQAGVRQLREVLPQCNIQF